MKSILALQLFALFTCTFCSTIRYDGHQVYAVHTSTPVLIDRLLQLRQNGISFWNEPNVYKPTLIMVSSEQQESFEQQLNLHGFEYRVTIKDVQQAIERTKEGSASGQMDWDNYHSLSTISSWVDSLVADYPNLVSVESIGQSYENRTLRVVKISTGGSGTKPAIFIDGGIHSNEWIAPATATYIMNQLITNYTNNKDIVDGIDWYFLPVFNVDGYEYTHTTDRMWRKTRSVSVPASGCTGTDPNRNYDFHWKASGGASDDPCSDEYRGPKAFSESETLAMAKYLTALGDKLKVYLNFHSFSEFWLLPWAYTFDAPDDLDDMKLLANDAVEALFLVHGTRFIAGPIPELLYLASGGGSDWVKGVAGIKYAYALELRDAGEYRFLLPPEQIIPSGEETFAAVRLLAERVPKM